MVLFLVFILCIISSLPAYGQDEFKTVQDISYEVDHIGRAQINHKITLSNKFSQIYAKEYTLNITPANFTNLSVIDANGTLPSQMSKTENTASVKITFPNPSVGKDKSHVFTLQYTVPEFAVNKGKTWEIQLPVFQNKFTDQQMNIELITPPDFGDISYSSIPFFKSHLIGDKLRTSFTQSKQDNKILLVYGDHQLFDLKLLYHLTNDEPVDIIQKIPLPPDTRTQTLTYESIEPQPQYVEEDQDGNWLGVYSIASGQSLDITVSGQAKIHPPIEFLAPTDLSNLTDAQKYWESDHPDIMTLATSLKNPREIHNFVVNTLDYNYQNIDTSKRKGALQALALPQLSLCTEFTDLFVAIARAKKIPAREIEGFAYSNNSRIKPLNPALDVLHAWPEFFDSSQKKWIQIDPTWEKTTNGIDYFTDLDLNHITFVIHGRSSDYPPPPGSYRTDSFSKSVFVDFAKNEIQRSYSQPAITVEDDHLIAKNSNLFQLRNIEIEVANDGSKYRIDRIPPLGEQKIRFNKESLLNSLSPKYSHYNILISSNESPDIVKINTQNKRHYLNLSIAAGISIFVLCLGGIILTSSHRSHEKNS